MGLKEESDKIEAAIAQGLSTSEDFDPSDILEDWIVVTYVTNPDDDKCGYPMFFSNGNLPHHRALGLLTFGLQRVSLGKAGSDD